MAAIGPGLVAAAGPAGAQPAARAVKVGVLRAPDAPLFRRVRAGTSEEIARLAAELVRLRMDAIVAIGPAAVRAATGATKSVPIVAVDLESDPMAERFVTGLARPGGNVTPGEPAPRCRGGGADGARGALVGGGAGARGDRGRLPVGGEHAGGGDAGAPEFAEEGGLIAYGPDVPDMFRQAGDVMVKVLRGTPPSEIPIERPARFELVVNRKTAASLGLTVRPSLLVRADRVIE